MSDNSHIEYRVIPDFPAYKVGADGSVWSRWERNGHQPRRLGAWHRLADFYDREGYRVVSLYSPDRRRRAKVHILVLTLFVGPRPVGADGCHNNGNAGDARLDNLRWASRIENVADKRRHGTLPRGERVGNARLTAAEVAAIRRHLARGFRQSAIAASFGVAPSTISGIACGRLWKEEVQHAS
jgi:hypothetical protein